MIINIASFGGRSHLLDLSRELANLGHEVRFYSYVPTRRAKHFGLNPKNNYSYFILALPFILLMQFTKQASWSEYLFHVVFDHIIAWYSKPCDVFIGQSPMHVYSLIYSKRKYKATVILERGTSHVLEQVKALSQNPKLKGKMYKPNYEINRDIKGYLNADYISIASEHVRKSFLKNSIPSDKLFINPYGVCVSDFKPTELISENIYDLIIVGQWSYRKGCDILIEACLNLDLKLLHVGPIVDMDFPTIENFVHVDPVDQRELANYYKLAKVFVLPSREEGLALVQLQAILCGLPIVCSKHTGGIDLKVFLKEAKWIIEMDNLSVEALVGSIKKALKLANTQYGLRSYYLEGNTETQLSWESYGKRYNDFLHTLI